MPDTPRKVTVAEKPAHSGEDPLWQDLSNAIGQPVVISVAAVARIDTRRLSMLLGAQRQWAKDGQSFAVVDLSPSFRQGLERLGLSSRHFDLEVA